MRFSKYISPEGSIVMKNLIELRNYQLVSSYGGVGSIIETLGGAMLIMPFDKWVFYKYVIEKADAEDLDMMSIDDSRLLARVRQDFPKLEHLIIAPSNNTEMGGTVPLNSKKIVSIESFPKWFYCPKCKRFMDIADWTELWRKLHPKHYDEVKHYTMCPNCAKFDGKRQKQISLEQVRFIQISDNGDMRDFPWQDWFTYATHSTKCSKHKLMYSPSSFSDNFESIHVSCQECSKDTTLRGIFGFSINDGFKTVLRSSNNIYFPRIISSILIPGTIGKVAMNDNEFKLEEYDHIMNMVVQGGYHDKYLYLNCAGDHHGIKVISIRDMTMTSVLCSYTRGAPQTSSGCFEFGRSKHITTKGIETEHLPAVRSAGEGFMLIIEDDMIRDWYATIVSERRFIDDVERIIRGESSSFFGKPVSEINKYAFVKTILLHTLSHLLIKQLEYSCGYPATSLNERVYSSMDYHAGIIIYSISGSEGSYGGLVSEVESKDFLHLLKESLLTARYCRSDPVCYESGSVCFSCTLVPETSCELSNRYLDRSMLVDSSYGFAKFLFDDYHSL